MTKEVTLKFCKAAFLGAGKVLPGFDFLRQHSAGFGAVTGNHRGTLGRSDLLDIDFDEVGKPNQCFPGIARHKIVQRDQVATFFKTLAYCHHSIVRRNAILDFHNYLGRQQGKVFHQQHLVGAVDECAMPVAQHTQADDI